MKKRFVLTVFLLVLVIAVYGCKKDGKNGGQASADMGIFNIGVDGLVLNFLKNAPPPQVYDQNNLQVAVQLHNLGTCTIGSGSQLCKGRLQLSGFDQNIIRLRESPIREIGQNPSLSGKGFANPRGGMEIIAWEGNVNLGATGARGSVEVYEPSLLATACYTYVTEATPIVCIDPDPYSTQIEDEVCQIGTVDLAGGQGAPIGITRVETSVINDPARSRIQFKIYVKNLGKGIVASPDNFFQTQECPRIDFSNVDRVKIYAWINSQGVNTMLDCHLNADRTVQLFSGEGFAICDAPLNTGISQAYTTPLKIELQYGYVDSVAVKVRIINVPS